MVKLALVQTPSVLLDKTATIAKAVTKIEEAAAQGANLVVFTEAFIPGYPVWIWRLRPGGDWGLSEQLHQRLLENSVQIDVGDLAPLQAAAKAHELTIVCGMNERDGDYGRATLYNSVVVIAPDGQFANLHRKLMPTNPERMVWGFGDGSSLKVVETPAGRIGSLICWENYMPLARYALYAQGVEIYIAPTYDSGEKWLTTMRHIAREAGCWVVGSGNLLHVRDLPDDFPDKERLYPNEDEWINPGDSVVIAPGGEMVAGPMNKVDEILYHELDLEQAAAAKRSLDVVGHYSRPDIFQLQVNTKPQQPVRFD